MVKLGWGSTANEATETEPREEPGQLRFCKACGKTVLNRCAYAGCPLS